MFINYQLYLEYGVPHIIDEVQVGIRMSPNSVSNQPGGYLHAGGNPNSANELYRIKTKFNLVLQLGLITKGN